MAQQTQLVAIMLSNIIGFDDLQSKDEPGAQTILTKNRLIQKPLVEKYSGSWLKEMEGQSWVSFANTVDAVNCARELQGNINLQPIFKLSISIHLGEVSIEGDELSGEAVLLTKEIEARKQKAGIYISETIYNTLKHNDLVGFAAGSSDTDTKKESSSKSAPESQMLSMDDMLLEKVNRVIEENINNEQFSVERLADEVALSRSHLHRKLQNLTNQSISQYVRSIRLKKAMQYLQDEVGNVSEVAFKVGFGSSTYFIKCFHEYYGYPPGEVKKKNTETSGEIETEFLGDKVLASNEEPVKLYHVKDTWSKEIAQRQLAAIMFTDIVGYTAIMNEDEGRGLKYVEANRELHKRLIDKHSGTWLKEMGDGVICYFQSAWDAIMCGLSIQGEVKGAGYTLRISIHLGDIVFQEGDIFGEGVNIASRLLPIGDPGSIIISEKVYDEIENKPEVQTQFLGSFNLRNISRPVGIHAITNPGIVIPDPVSIQEKLNPSELEGKQPINIQLIIRDVFSELIKHKPSLEKYLMVDEDEEEEIDNRLLAYQIIKNYPWPIGIEIRRIFSGSLRNVSLARLLQLFKAIDRIQKFLLYILVTEIFDKKVKGELVFDEKLGRNLTEKLTVCRSANVVEGLKICWEIVAQSKVELFMPEMEKIFDGDLPNRLQEWANNKDQIVESAGHLSEEDITTYCSEFERLLVDFLKACAFLVRYRLVNIGDIKVIKPKNRNATFHHSIDILNSSDSDFRTREETLATFADSNAVLFIKSFKDTENFLNLSPLVIDTRNEPLDARTNMKIKKDIFMYNSFNGTGLQYSGTEITKPIDLTGLSSYSRLQEEFEGIIEALGGSK